MNTLPMKESILNALISRPSRASVTTIGHRFVLNGAPPRLQVRGLDALAAMTCDWSVAIFELAINDPTRRPQVRLHALELLADLLHHAIGRGYHAIDGETVRSLAEESALEIRLGLDLHRRMEIPQVAKLCNHLGEAIAQGCFAPLPDF